MCLPLGLFFPSCTASLAGEVLPTKEASTWIGLREAEQRSPLLGWAGLQWPGACWWDMVWAKDFYLGPFLGNFLPWPLIDLFGTICSEVVVKVKAERR